MKDLQKWKHKMAADGSAVIFNYNQGTVSVPAAVWLTSTVLLNAFMEMLM